jgi:hypothetical protein
MANTFKTLQLAYANIILGLEGNTIKVPMLNLDVTLASNPTKSVELGTWEADTLLTINNGVPNESEIDGYDIRFNSAFQDVSIDLTPLINYDASNNAEVEEVRNILRDKVTAMINTYKADESGRYSFGQPTHNTANTSRRVEFVLQHFSLSDRVGQLYSIIIDDVETVLDL